MRRSTRSQPGLPLKPGKAGTMTHDYKRNGTTTLFAARDYRPPPCHDAVAPLAHPVYPSESNPPKIETEQAWDEGNPERQGPS